MVELIQQRSTPTVAAALPMLLTAAVLLAVLLSSTTGTDADQQPAYWSFLFWLSHTVTGLFLMSGITRLLTGHLPATLPPWQQLLVSGVLGALCFAPVALLLELCFAAMGFAAPDTIQSALGEADVSNSGVEFGAGQLLGELGSEFLNMAPPFVLSWLLLNLSYQSLRPPSIAAPSQPPPTASPNRLAAAEPAADPKPVVDTVADALATPAATGLLAQLPPALGQDVQLVSADLNYVHVVTANGKLMLLYSLSRAASELGDRGLQVHRSHWVSKTAVAAVRRSSRGLQIELLDGSLIPVSRRRERLVRAEFGVDFRRQRRL